MEDAKATFYRAELARTPAAFMPLDAAAIQAELERRWDEKNGVITLDDKLSDHDAKGNFLTYCGQTTLGHRYMLITDSAAGSSSAGATPPAPCRNKRSREEEATQDLLETFLGRFKKDTLQSMCEDLEVPVSGNKSELIYRIMLAEQ